jgi:sec-independent protein translocase protein TatB
MFNIGFGELAVICIVLIIAVGPERLPSMMKTLGKTLRTLRQASRDIRASTGIDELMREDFDLYAPVKPNPPRRPAVITAPEEPAALPASTEASVPTTPAANVADEPKPVSREEIIEEGDRPSVVVAPPPQAIGLPSEDPAPEPQPSAAVTEVSAPAPQLTAAADPSTLPRESTPPPRTPREDTLPRAPIVQAAQPSSNAQAAHATHAAQPTQPEPQPKAADDEELAKNDSASSEPKQSGA